jgi:glycosyltransferase involved in cell wall biosynthesis
VLAEEMAAARIDHAHAHFATAAARLVNLAWRMGGPSYSVTAHAKDIYHEEVRVDHLRDKLASASFVATVSRANRDHLQDVLGERGILHVVPNAVDLARLGDVRPRPSPSRRVLSVARLVEKKGLPDLVQACALLERRNISVELEIAGEGELRPELERAAARMRSPVTFHGALPHEQVLDLYRGAAVFCLPCVVAASGDRDGLPTSVLEAMALGLPVVTTAVNGLADVVLHEETGLIVPEHDPSSVAAAIARLLEDEELVQRLARHARAHVEANFSLERSVSLLRLLFSEAA